MAQFVPDESSIMGQGVVQDPCTGNTALQSYGPSGCISIEDQNDYVFSLLNPNDGVVFHRSGDAISGNIAIESVCAELYLSDGFTKNFSLTQPFERELVSGYSNYSIIGCFNEIFRRADVSASPGFTWGRSGNNTAGTYLLNDSVPSNITGRIVPIVNGFIAEVFVAVQNNTTATFALEKRTGATFTELLTITLTAQRTNVQSYSVAVSRGDELAMKIKDGSAQNPVIGVVIKGETS